MSSESDESDYDTFENQWEDGRLRGTLGSLPKLIERLKDPDGDPVLSLYEEDLMAMVAYDGLEDFAEVYLEFLDAVKTNTTITEIYFDPTREAGADNPLVDNPQIFPIINTLCRHLPKAEALRLFLHVDEELEADSTICKEIKRFKTVHIEEIQGVRVANFDLHPDLEVFRYEISPPRMPNPPSIDAPAIPHLEPGRALLSLPLPSKLRELTIGAIDDCDIAAPTFTQPELSRLVDVVQIPSLMKLSLKDFHFSSMEQCNQFARGLAGSPAKDLCLRLFTPEVENFRDVVDALPQMQNLESLNANFSPYRHWMRDPSADEDMDGWFSIPVGDIVRRASRMKSLKIGQHWKPWDDAQCQDLAAALREPSCGLKTLDICDRDREAMIETETKWSGMASIMAAFSAPSSLIEGFAVVAQLFEKEDADAWLSGLPRTTALQSLRIKVALPIDTAPCRALTEPQQKRFLSIVSGWYYLSEMTFHQESMGLVDIGTPNRRVVTRHHYLLGKDCRKQLDTLMRLNVAGRHYLASSTRSKTDGVEVLSKVVDELDDIYTHLLENPCLCDR